MPYHPLGEDKLSRMGRPEIVNGLERPDDRQMELLGSLVESSGVATTIGG